MLKTNLDVVKNIMVENIGIYIFIFIKFIDNISYIEKIFERGEKIEILVQKSKNMNIISSNFKNQVKNRVYKFL